ncbi:AAA family ATPase [Streptomyces sp. NPDC003077]|uniref:AAA family ATPase n=1 Tax=Streptomyces sp. NPDC003077 TaxID=3154443 RepID=UPI0033AC1319
MRPVAFTVSAVIPPQEHPPRTAVRPRGRDHALTAVRTALARASNRGGTALAVRGESGSGKTTLLRWAAGTAAGADGRVLRVTGRPGAGAPAYAALRSLTAPLLRAPEALPPTVRSLLPDALRHHTDTGDETPVCSALWQTLAAVAGRRPLLLAVDDWQWLDPASARALAFLAHRLDGTRVLLLAAAEGPEPFPLTDCGVTELPLTALGDETARQVLSDRHPRLSADARTAVLAAAEGNPLALVSLPTGLTPEQRAGRAPLPDPLPPGAALERRLGRRFRALPAGTRALLAALALMDEDAEAGDVAWLADALGYGLDAFGPAEEAGLVSSGRVPRFVRRVHRCLAHATAPAAVRRRARHAWVELGLARLGGGRPGNGPAGRDEDGVARLEALGRAAVAARRWSTAVTAFRQAGELGPAPVERTRLHTAAASAAVCGGRPRLALALTREPAVGPAPATARALRAVRATTLFDVAFHAEESFRDLSAALDAGPVAGADVRDWAAFQLATLSPLTHRSAPARAALRALRPSAGATDPLRLAVTACLNPVARARDIREGLSVAAARALGTPDGDPHELTWLADAAWRIDDIGLSGRLLAAALRQSGTGEKRHLPHCWELRAELMTAEGRWEELRDLVARRTARSGAEGPGRHAVALKSRLLLVCAYQGRREEAGELADEIRRWARAHHSAHHARLAEYAALLLAQGGDAARTGGPGMPGGAARPSGADPCLDTVTRQAHAVLVRGALLRDDHEAARAHHQRAQRDGLARFSGEATLLVRHGRALLAAYADESDAAELFGLAEEAATVSARPFDRALLALDHGMWLRRRRELSAARTRLRAAYETFGRLGATPWQDRARTELRAIGAPPPGTARSATGAGTALSAHERRVVRLAASGLSNREIADRLLVSPRTVASHLYKVFPRLGISSRRELQGALLGGGDLL